MKRKSILVLLMIFVIGIVGCGNNAKKSNDIDVDALQKKLMEADTTLPSMKQISSKDKEGELKFTALSDIDYSLVDSYAYAYAKDGTAEEIAVIVLKDEADAAELMESLHKHLENRKGTMQVYAPEQVSMVENAVVTYHGACVTLIVSNKCGVVQQAFDAYFK